MNLSTLNQRQSTSAKRFNGAEVYAKARASLPEFLIDEPQLEFVDGVVGLALRECADFVVKLLKLRSDLFKKIYVFCFHN